MTAFSPGTSPPPVRMPMRRRGVIATRLARGGDALHPAPTLLRARWAAADLYLSSGMTSSTDIATRAAHIAELAERRWATPTDTHDARERARQLRDHVTTYVLPRVASLDTPLVVVLLGPTGAGKSSLMNALAGSAVSPSGVLRPTTRTAIVIV